MLFNSLRFLYVFLPITYLVFWSLNTKRERYVWLTVTGYAFYAAWNWKFCFLMAFSTLVSYQCGRALRLTDNARRRTLFLTGAISVDLLLLGFFKYYNFSVTSLAAVAHWAGYLWRAPTLDVVLPIGISFYTFHTISYVVDCYRRDVEPTTDFWEYCCYVSLFSQLVAGPIVRFRQIEGDLQHIARTNRRDHLERGWSFFGIGMFQKVLLADNIARIVDPALLNFEKLSTAGVWLCILGYTYQLYFDFAGYSNMAVGLGQMFGIRIPQNFNSPYKAVSIADFWQRWHISLSSCLRDYVYIPFGGNRGTRLFTARNLMLTMLIGGLWHGANWTFVIWGAYHGVLLTTYRFFGARWDRMPVVLQRLGTFLLVVVGWVFFRATSLTMAGHLLRAMVGFLPGTTPSRTLSLSLLVLLAAIIAHQLSNTFEIRHEWRKPALVGLTMLWIAALCEIASGTPSPFLYFQF
jgi:alginate O-acetyltransferase complex protein AlgI